MADARQGRNALHGYANSLAAVMRGAGFPYSYLDV
jgi:hypothetical protein